MSLRTIEFTVSADGSVTPVTEQKAGIQGEHNKTELVISVFKFENLTTSIFLKDVIRIQFIDGAGGFYSTEILNKDEEGNVRCTIPDEVTNAGGLVCAYVVLTQLYDTGSGPVRVKNVSISKPCKLRFEHSGVGSPSEYAYRVNISGALLNAQQSAEAAENYADNSLNYSNLAKDYSNAAKTAQSNAEAAANQASSNAEAAEKEKTKAENAAIKAEEAAEKAIAFAKVNSLVFDTKEHLNQFIGGYESTKNLCPLPRIHSNDKYTLTHNDNGTFNFDVSHDIGEPEPFGRITLEPGVYVFTRYNCEFYIGITFDQMIPISKPFEVTETTEYELCSSGYAGDSFKNAWVQITKGESVPDEFIPYYAPYTREDGKTVNDLSPGDILLITEEGVSDYWWDGNAIRPIEAQADQTFNPKSENAQSGIAIDKYVTDNFSDVIVETSHSVNSPAEIDCCLKGRKIVGGNILGAEPQIIQGKNLCPTPEYKFEQESYVCVCVPNEDGTFNYTGLRVNGIQLPLSVELSQGTYYFSASNSIFTLYVPSIYEATSFISPGTQFTIAAEKDKAYLVIWDRIDHVRTLENCWVQIEKGTKATPFVKYTKPQLYLPHNLVMHFSPTNPIKNRNFIGDGITIEQAGTALHYTFAGDYDAAFNANSTQIEVGQEYIMRFDVTCTDQNNPSKWCFGVFSKKQCSSACNVAAKSQTTIRKADTEQPVYQSGPQNISYTHFSGCFPMNNGQRYIVELVFTSAYSGEVYFAMRNEESATSLNLNSCLFCKTESLPMLVDKKINTNLLSIGSISDSIDLATGQKIQQIMMDELSFEEEQLVVNNYTKALPSVPAYFVSGTLKDADWVECVTPTSGTMNYTLTQPLSKGYIVYATRTPVTEQLEFELPTVCADEFEVYTSSDDNVVPYFQTSVDTKKSANSYLKKISNAIISMGGNI